MSVDGIALPRRAFDLALDVELEGRRIFSHAPHRSCRSREASVLAWPEVLRPYLRGVGRVRVLTRDGTTLVDEECMFDSSDGRTRVEDASGRPLALDKNRRLQRTFGASDPQATAAALDQVEMAFGVLVMAGVSAFLTAGALLGAVRDGRLIGHDSDIDLAYLSAATTPAGVALESYRLQRLFTQRGVETRRFSAAEFKLLLGGPGGVTAVDVRAAVELAGSVYVAPNIELPPGARSLLPLSEVKLEGRRFPAPADPTVLLAAMYGPNWQVPDPSFRFETPERLTRRLDGWVRGGVEDRSAWQRWHLARMGTTARAPTDFAQWVAKREPALAPVVDLGCGAGTDAVWLARSGRWVLGLDFAPNALVRARAAATRAKTTTAHFDECTLGDLRGVLVRGARFARARTPRSLYAHRLVEGLSPSVRNNVWLLASMTLRRGGRLYVELGTVTSDDTPPVVHRRAGRHALSPETVIAEITQHGGHIQHCERLVGASAPDHGDPPMPGVDGSARSGDEPRGTRLVATWQR